MIKEKSHVWIKISRHIGLIFARSPLSPNTYTWLTVPVAVVAMLLIIQHQVWFGVSLFLVAGILDMIDGALARQLGKSSYYGAFLDGSLDRFIDFMVIFSYFWLPIVTVGLPLSQWICLAVFFAIMPSFLVAYANHRQAVPDPTETIVWRILNRGEMYILMLTIPALSLYSSRWAGYLLIALVGLSAITTLQTLFTTLYLAAKANR